MLRILVCVFSFLQIQYMVATPSSIFWTNCTTDVYAPGIVSLEMDNFFTVFNRNGRGRSFPPDWGLELGLFDSHDLQAEAGVDYFGGINDPVFFNTKVAVKEGKFFKESPAFSVGIFNVGTRGKGFLPTNLNVLNFVIGKTLPEKIGGRVFAAFYSGNKFLGDNRQGFMVAYTHNFVKAKYCDGTDYYKWQLAADYASGKNFIGGGGAAIVYYFTPNITIETGSVFFNSAKFNGTWKWGTLLTINFSILKDSKSK